MSTDETRRIAAECVSEVEKKYGLMIPDDKGKIMTGTFGTSVYTGLDSALLDFERISWIDFIFLLQKPRLLQVKVAMFLVKMK
jgi:hypothetical protein